MKYIPNDFDHNGFIHFSRTVPLRDRIAPNEKVKTAKGKWANNTMFSHGLVTNSFEIK